MKIINIIGKEILDCRGMPTVACDIQLEDNSIFSASVPVGTSRSKYEAVEIRDEERFFGLGVQKSVDIINNKIAPHFLGKEPNAIQMDLDMIQMDGTANKSKFGANSILAVSMAMYRAHAYITQTELFDFIALVSGSDTVSLPLPMINFISGGMHANNNLLIQEYLIIPYGAQNMRTAIENSIVLFNILKQLLQKKGKVTLSANEGGFAPKFKSITEPFDFINKAIEESNLGPDIFALGIDVAASQFYDQKTSLYTLNGIEGTNDEMIDLYEKMIKKYNIYSIEDGLSEDDWSGWVKFTNKFGKNIHVIGDDLFATNPELIAKGIEFAAANSAIIKPNQIGTITETLQSIQLCKEYGFSTIVSHRSAETNDTFIVDIAVGASSNYIKCGGLTRGERIAKYNRLLEIENNLTNLIVTD